MKSIQIDIKTWEKLMYLKIKSKHSTMCDVIKKLLEDVKKRI